MRLLIVLAMKDLRVLARDRMAMFWVFAFPLLFGGFFGLILEAVISREATAHNVLIVDQADTESSRELVDRLQASQHLVVRMGEQSEIDASVRTGDHVAALRIPPDFMLSGADGRSTVELTVDPTRIADAPVVRGALFDAAGEAAGWHAARAGDDVLGPPLALREVPLENARGGVQSAFELVFSAAILWAMMGCAASFAVSIVVERTQGTFARLRSSPLTAVHILGGKALACLIASLTSALVLTLIAVFVLNVRMENVGAAALAVVCIAVAFVGLTMLLGTLGKTEQSVAGAGWGSFIVMAMVGGGMIPLAFMPDWMHTVAALSPLRWGVVAMEAAAWRGAHQPEYLTALAQLLGLGVTCFGLGAWRLRRMAVH